MELERVYTEMLVDLAREPGVVGTIFRKSQNRIQDPAKLQRLVQDLIGLEHWSATGTDITGDAYESLLAKGASDKGSGAGQYFTPRALIQAMVDVIDPTIADTVVDPASGTGGFLLVAHDHVKQGAASLTPTQRDHLRDGLVYGYELVDATARLAAMNMLLHGVGTASGASVIDVRDSLVADPGRRWSVVLSNPPFGRKSALATIGRKLLADFDLHTMLRLPTGLFYAQGVKANVLFFDKKQARPGQPWTERLWVYDLRTNKHFTLKQNPLRRADLDDFVACFAPGRPRSARVESERFRAFDYAELIARDKANLDITWLKDDSLVDLDNLPSPDVIAREIVEDLTAALAEFEAVAAALEDQLGTSATAEAN